MPTERITTTVDTGAIARGQGGITDAAAHRILKDVHKRWRGDDGRVLTLAEMIEEEGISSRTAHVENGSRKYALTQALTGTSARTHLPVCKATFDYFAGTFPDDRSPADIARQDATVYEASLERNTGPIDADKRSRRDALNAEADRLHRAESAAYEAEHGTWQERDTMRKQRQADRERAPQVAVD